MTARNWLLPARMGSVRLLLLSVLTSTLIAACLVAALAGFAAGALPRAISNELARSQRTSISIYGAFGAAQLRADQPKIHAALRRAFRPLSFTSDEAVWSDPIALPGHGRTVSLVQAATLTGIRSRVRLTAGTWPARPGPRPAARSRRSRPRAWPVTCGCRWARPSRCATGRTARGSGSG